MVEVKCLNCDKTFSTHNCQIRRGGGKFCSLSCTRTYKNLHDNPAKRKEVRDKISKNHADVSGKNNPMYGIKFSGIKSPSYKDGRSNFKGRTSRRICLATQEMVCELCGENDIKKLQVHHKDKNRNNNKLENLSVLCEFCHNNIVHKYIRDEKTGRYISQVTDNSKLK